jgi:hypothetical protein
MCLARGGKLRTQTTAVAPDPHPRGPQQRPGGRKIAQVLRNTGEVAAPAAITEWLNYSVRFLRAIELPGLLGSRDL